MTSGSPDADTLSGTWIFIFQAKLSPTQHIKNCVTMRNTIFLPPLLRPLFFFHLVCTLKRFTLRCQHSPQPDSISRHQPHTGNTAHRLILHYFHTGVQIFSIPRKTSPLLEKQHRFCDASPDVVGRARRGMIRMNWEGRRTNNRE